MNSKMVEGFMYGVFASIVCSIFIKNPPVEQTKFNKALDVCVNNGGMEFMRPESITQYAFVKCNNGVTFIDKNGSLDKP